MTFRRKLFCLAAVVALCGTATARPPISPLPEGRELDPVTRDYYLVHPPTIPTEDIAPARTERPAVALALTAMLVSVCEAILQEMTIPLGTVQPAGGAR